MSGNVHYDAQMHVRFVSGNHTSCNDIMREMQDIGHVFMFDGKQSIKRTLSKNTHG